MNSTLLVQPFDFEPDILDGELQLSLLSLASYLRSKAPHINLDFLDLKVEHRRGQLLLPREENQVPRFERDLERLVLEKRHPTVIGITCLTSKQYLPTRFIAKRLKELYPESTIVVGGYHPTFMPRDFTGLTIKGVPVFDYIVRGDGERAFANIVLERSKENPPFGKRTRILVGESIQNLELIPPVDFQIYQDYIRDYTSTSLALSRGCPYQCNFCVERQLYKLRNLPRSLRVLSPSIAAKRMKGMVEQIESLAPKIKNFGVFDACFGFQPEWRTRFLEEIAGMELFSGEKACWVETRIDILRDSDLKLYKEAGVKSFFGLESGSKKMLSIMNKTRDPSQYLDRASKLMQIGGKLEYDCSFGIIVNFPGESSTTLSQTLKFLENVTKMNPKVWISASLFQNFPGTDVFLHMPSYQERFGTRFYHPDWWRLSTKNLRFLASRIDASGSFVQEELANIFYPEYARLVMELGKRLKRDGHHEMFLRAFNLIRALKKERALLLDIIEDTGTLLSAPPPLKTIQA